MPVIAPRTGAAVSDSAKARLAHLKTYPTLDTWRNPLTRPIARHFVHEAWLKTVNEIDFEYRLSDRKVGGVRCVLYETDGERKDAPVVLYVHGGEFISGSPETHAAIVLPPCRLSGAQAVGVDFSLLPEARFPTQLDEVDHVYKGLRSAEPDRKIVLMADSTGAALALAAMMRWRDGGLAAPAGAVFISPCVDGAGASDTHIALDGQDPLIRSFGGKFFRQLFGYYAPGCDLRNPEISPIYGRFEWLPPLLIHVGAREVLLGDAARLAETARRAGVDAQLRVFDGMFHLFHMHWSLDEAKAAHQDVADFIKGL